MPRLRQWARQALFPRITSYHIAATLLTFAAAFANARMGVSFGSGQLDKFIYACASIGADLWLLGGFLLTATYLKKKEYGPATAAGIATALTLTYSIVSGFSFVTQVTEAALGPRRAIERTDTINKDELTTVRNRLNALPAGKPSGELKAEMDKILSDRKAGGCQTMDGPYTKENCPRYFKLKAQHASAVEREKLVEDERNLLGLLKGTKTIEAADPLEAALKQLGSTALEGLTRPYVALLFVLMGVLGGPLAMWSAEARLELREQPTDAQQSTDSVKYNTQSQQTPKPPRATPRSVAGRPRQLQAVSPAGDKVIKNLRKRGGQVSAKTQAKLAGALGVPRTSYRRVVDPLERDGLIKTSHDAQGYKVALH